MGNAISFRLNPKNESDKKILAWLEKKSSQPGYLNQTEAIKKAILTAIEDERKENREKSIEDWISEAILLSREEFIKIVKESSQNVANNVFAGVLGVISFAEFDFVIPNLRSWMNGCPRTPQEIFETYASRANIRTSRLALCLSEVADWWL